MSHSRLSSANECLLQTGRWIPRRCHPLLLGWRLPRLLSESALCRRCAMARIIRPTPIWFRAISSHWEELPLAIEPGPAGIRPTRSAVSPALASSETGRFYMFYTGFRGEGDAADRLPGEERRSHPLGKRSAQSDHRGRYPLVRKRSIGAILFPFGMRKRANTGCCWRRARRKDRIIGAAASP